jgi:mannose-6-phosphate isomerase-like protein (cupin superfamily)
MEKVDLAAAFASFDEQWAPRIVTRVNDYDVKIVRVAGEFPEHVHEDTDEFFHVLAGQLRLDLPDGTVALGAGQVITVPRGVRHRPTADEGTLVLLFEPRGTINTGDPSTGSIGVALG